MFGKTLSSGANKTKLATANTPLKTSPFRQPNQRHTIGKNMSGNNLEAVANAHHNAACFTLFCSSAHNPANRKKIIAPSKWQFPTISRMMRGLSA